MAYIAPELAEGMPLTRIAPHTMEISGALVTNVGAAASGIVNSLLTAVAGASLDTLKPAFPNIVSDKRAFAATIPTFSISDIDLLVEAELGNDYNFIVDAIKAGIGQGVGSIHASLYETIVGTNALLQSYRGLTQRIGIDPYISRWANQTFQPNIPDAETAWFMRQINVLDNDTYLTMISQNGWNADWRQRLESAWTRQPSVSTILDARRRGLMTDDDMRHMLRWFRFNDWTIEKIVPLSQQFPEPYRLAEMYSKGYIDLKTLTDTMGFFGLSWDWATRWASSQLQFPPIDACLTMLRRGIMTEDDFVLYLNRQQFGSYQAMQLMQLVEAIPPIQDLIRFAVREAYGDHDPEKQYNTMVANAKRMGLSEEASGWYWYAHWDRIPITLMYQNYYRGLWDKTKLERMLKIVDIHPDDRTDIMNVAFQPPSIREMGYGYDVGAYTLDDIKRFRRWGGLSPEDSDKAAEAMVAYRTEAERNAVRTEYVYAYGRGALTIEQLTTKLTEIKTPAEAIPLWIERATLYSERIKKPTTDTEGKITSSSEAILAFKIGLRNEEWLRSALQALSWTPDRIDVAVERAKQEMSETEKKEQEVKYRKLTLAQIRQSYIAGLYTQDQVTTEITLLGYDVEDAKTLTSLIITPAKPTAAVKNYTISDAVRLYKYQIFTEEDIYDNYLIEGYDSTHAGILTLMTKLNDEYPTLESLYEKGFLNTVNFKEQLVKIGMGERDALNLVNRTVYEFQVSRLAKEKDLTKAEILKGAKNNVLTPTQAANLLQDIGYDQNEAMYLLAINKIIEAGDPEGYWDMRRTTELYKKARGEKYIEIPDELIALEKQQKQLKAQLEDANRNKATEEVIGNLTVQLGSVEKSMKDLMMLKGLK